MARSHPSACVQIYTFPGGCLQAIACACWGALWAEQYGLPSFGSVLFVAPAVVFVVGYIRWLHGPAASKKRRVLAAVVNCAVAGALLGYLVLVVMRGEVQEYSWLSNVLLIITGPITFALGCVAMFKQSRASYGIVSIIALIAWTYLACVVIRPRFEDAVHSRPN